jgi:lipoprotein-anchoring transpeptidase ErfK/SrfK
VTVVLLSLVAFSGQVVQASQSVEEKSTQETSARNLHRARAEATPLAPRETGYSHIEIDLSRERLSVVDGSGRVVKTLPVSSGSGKLFTSEGRTRRAITPKGRFTVFRKISGWHKSPLGMLYYPSYITQGVAIHGSSSVPPRPASHGCIRIPMSAAKAFYDATPIGTVVLVH